MDVADLAVKVEAQSLEIKNQGDKITSLESKLDQVLEQVTLGKHMVEFAKMAGWFIGVIAACVEVYRSLRGS